MRLQDIPEDIEPRVGDIIEIEQDDVCFEVRIIGITADGYLCEQDNIQGALLLEGVALDHDDVTDITGYITEEKVRLDPKCWKGKKIGNPKTKMKGGVRVNNCVPEGQEDIEESGLQYYTGVKKHGEKYMKLAAKAGREGASQEELGRLRDRYSKAEKTKESVEQDVAEAGPFSYGYKKPRKGSVAYWAEKKRKEQEKGKPPIEPKDQMVGVAKVTKAVAEGQQDLAKPITYYSLVHKATNKVLSTHKDLESAKDEHRGMDQGERAHYRIAASTKAPKSFSMKEDAEGVAEDISSTKKKISKYEELALAANRAGDDAKCKQYQQKIQVLKQKMSQGVAEAGMPSSVIKSKQRYSQMTPAEFAQAHKDKSDDELISMAWRHGYGKGSKHYVDKRNKGKQGVAEGYTGRETKDGTWRVFKDGQAVAVAGPFNSRDEAHAWIKKHKQGVSEAKSLKKRVRVVQGEHAGKTGWIREIKHGVHSTAPKRYYVDIDGGGQADNLPASALRLLKDQSDSQKGMAEGGHDDQFSLSGKMPATDRIPQDSTQHQDRQLAMGDKIKQQTIAYILNLRPEFERSDLELETTPKLIQMLRDIQSGKMTEAEYQGRKVALGKPMAGDVKKSKVYVRKPNGKVVKVNFGDKKMKIKKSNPNRRKSFRARHNCENPGPRWKARYWSCRAW